MEQLIRFADLKANGIVTNRPQLRRLIDQQGFPEPLILSANARAWPKSEIDAWLATRQRAGGKAATG